MLQPLYRIRIVRLLLKKLQDELLFRWFMDLRSDDPIWPLNTFTFNDAAGQVWPSHYSLGCLLNEQIMGRFLKMLMGGPEVQYVALPCACLC